MRVRCVCHSSLFGTGCLLCRCSQCAILLHNRPFLNQKYFTLTHSSFFVASSDSTMARSCGSETLFYSRCSQHKDRIAMRVMQQQQQQPWLLCLWQYSKFIYHQSIEIIKKTRPKYCPSRTKTWKCSERARGQSVFFCCLFLRKRPGWHAFFVWVVPACDIHH
jgi:hypothetical protein